MKGSEVGFSSGSIREPQSTRADGLYPRRMGWMRKAHEGPSANMQALGRDYYTYSGFWSLLPAYVGPLEVKLDCSVAFWLPACFFGVAFCVGKRSLSPRCLP